jgi:hypothetical protein
MLPDTPMVFDTVATDHKFKIDNMSDPTLRQIKQVCSIMMICPQTDMRLLTKGLDCGATDVPQMLVG